MRNLSTTSQTFELSQPFGSAASTQPAWFVISTLGVFTVICLIAKAGFILRLGFPVASFATGVFLFRNFPAYYVGFSWWIWIITPFLARLIDYQTVWDPQRSMMVAPFLVSGISGTTIFRNLLKSNNQENTAFLIVAGGLSYGALIGAASTSPMSVARALLDWMIPVAFGYHMMWNWKSYPQFSAVLSKTFIWGVLVTGSYAIFQFMVAPDWDCNWLIQSGMGTSMGNPEPFGLRVWSTMHSASAFSGFMMSGLIILLSSQSVLQLPATAVGYLSFLLSLVRSSWGGWLIALLIMTSSIKMKAQVRLVSLIIAIVILIIPLSSMDPFASVVSGRLETITDLSNDTSFNVRTSNLGQYFLNAISNPLGQGIGNVWVKQADGTIVQQVTDNGIVDLLFTLGLLGGIPYLMGVYILSSIVLKSRTISQDSLMSAARGISISFVIQMIFANSLIGLGGMLMWGFLGTVLSGDRYYLHQQEANAHSQ
jgi:hypothetical protein